jgi:hypothetical protein
VPRSITGTPLRRRTARLAALLVAPAVAAMLLSGCGAGQVSQTDTMVPAVPGANVNSKDGRVSLRDMQIKYNSPEGYSEGSTTPLIVYIANNNVEKPLVLRGVTATDKADGASIGNVVLAGGAPDIGVNPSGTPSAGGSPSATATPSASGSQGAGATPSPSAPSQSPSAAPSGRPATLTIPPNGFARLSPDHGAYLAISALKVPLKPGSTVYLTFNFEGVEPIGALVPFGVPLSPAPRLTPSGTSEEQ